MRYRDRIFAGSLAAVDEVGYDPATPRNAAHLLTVSGVGGSYRLSYRGATTEAIPFDAPASAVQAALQALATVDHDGSPGVDVVVSGGAGGPGGGHHYRVELTDALPPGDAYGRLGAVDVDLAGGGAGVVARCIRCADVYRPDEATPPAPGRPVVVLVHGGGLSGGAKDPEGGDPQGIRMQRWATELAERGYVAVPIAYQLEDPADLPYAPCDWDGVDGPPCPAVWYDALTAARHDAQALVRWLRWSAQPLAAGGLGNPYGIDPDRIVMMGESAGAMVSLASLYRSDDPGTVGVTTTSSEIQAAVAIAGLTVDSWQDPGEGPALLLSSTNDPLAEIWGTDMYDEGREVVARGLAVGNDVQLDSWCRRVDQNGDAVPDAVHLFPLADPGFDRQVERVVRFLHGEVVDPSDPAGARWRGLDRSQGVATGAGQTMIGDHEPLVGDFDGDGTDDIVWFGAGAECDAVWWGRTDGTFSDPDETIGFTFVPALDLPDDGQAVVGDFDGDGADDLWVTSTPVPGPYRMLSTGGSRTFATTELDGLSAELTSLAGDLDGDGQDDLVLVWSEGGYVIVGHGGASPTAFEDLGYAAIPVGTTATLADVDGDGREDLVGVAPGGGVIGYGQARPAPAVLDLQEVAALAGTGDPVALDADGDGVDDVVVRGPGAEVAVHYGSSVRGQLDAGRAWWIDSARTVRAGDLDGDGADDLLWQDPAQDAVLAWYGTASRQVFPFVPVALPGVPGGWTPTMIELDGVPSPEGHDRRDVLWSPSA